MRARLPHLEPLEGHAEHTAASLHGLQRVIAIAPQGSVRRRSLLRKLPVPHDRSEDIVEVMGDAAGQRPHRLHLLRLPQLRLQAFLVEFRLFLRAYVDCGADEPIRLAGRVAQTPATREQPMPRAVRLTYAVLALVLRRTPLEMIRYGGLEARHVVGVNDDVRPPRGASWDCSV